MIYKGKQLAVFPADEIGYNPNGIFWLVGVPEESETVEGESHRGALECFPAAPRVWCSQIPALHQASTRRHIRRSAEGTLEVRV